MGRRGNRRGEAVLVFPTRRYPTRMWADDAHWLPEVLDGATSRGGSRSTATRCSPRASTASPPVGRPWWPARAPDLPSSFARYIADRQSDEQLVVALPCDGKRLIPMLAAAGGDQLPDRLAGRANRRRVPFAAIARAGPRAAGSRFAQHEDELVAADPRDRVRLAHRAREPIGEADQHLVAGIS